MYVVRYKVHNETRWQFLPCDSVDAARRHFGNARLFPTKEAVEKYVASNSWGSWLKQHAAEHAVVPVAEVDEPYVLVSMSDETAFTQQVANLIRCGYRPAGGMTLNRSRATRGESWDCLYSQALARCPGHCFHFDEA